MAPSTPWTPLSADKLDRLTHLSSLLHLLHHRSHNQHRRSIWYRHFSLLRRHLSQLVTDLTLLSSTPTTNLERTRLKARAPQLRARIEQRLDFWMTVLVPRWSRAFSQIVADGRFSVIGLVLTAILAEVCGVTGLTVRFEDLGQVEVENVIEEFGRELWEVDGTEGREGGDGARREIDGEDLGKAVAWEDEGEVVAREDDMVPEALPLSPDHGEAPAVSFGRNDEDLSKTDAKPERPRADGKGQLASSKAKKRPAAEPSPAPAKKKKKKRKGGDAIDDLFSDL